MKTSLQAFANFGRNWLQPWRNAAPTADIYFRHPLGDLIGDSDHPIRPAGPNTYVCGDRLVVIRYATNAEVTFIASRPWRSIHYILDDMLPKAAESPDLPDSYRQRMDKFARTVLPRILEQRPIIVASSNEILDLFPGFEGRRVDPCLVYPLPGDAHFAEASWRARRQIAFFGTASHLASIPFLHRIVEGIVAADPIIRVTMFLGGHDIGGLATYPQLINYKALPWTQFRSHLKAHPYHIVLAPLPDTPFNAGRSLSKLMDIAGAGAAGLFSDRAPFREVVSHGENGLLIGDDPDNWIGATTALLADCAATAALARNAAILASRIGDPAILRAFWREELMLAGV
jgi:hypothetical protein